MPLTKLFIYLIVLNPLYGIITNLTGGYGMEYSKDGLYQSSVPVSLWSQYEQLHTTLYLGVHYKGSCPLA